MQDNVIGEWRNMEQIIEEYGVVFVLILVGISVIEALRTILYML